MDSMDSNKQTNARALILKMNGFMLREECDGFRGVCAPSERRQMALLGTALGILDGAGILYKTCVGTQLTVYHIGVLALLLALVFVGVLLSMV